MKAEEKLIDLEIGKYYKLDPHIRKIDIVSNCPLVCKVEDFGPALVQFEEIETAIHRSWVISEATELDKVLE